MNMPMRVIHTDCLLEEDMHLCLIKGGIWILDLECRADLPIIQCMHAQDAARLRRMETVFMWCLGL